MDPIDLLPEPQAADARAILSMQNMINWTTDPELQKDLYNRIAQAMERLVAWEQANPELAQQVAVAAETLLP